MEAAIRGGRQREAINRERAEMKGINEEIEIIEWNRYFERLLKEVGNRELAEKMM